MIVLYVSYSVLNKSIHTLKFHFKKKKMQESWLFLVLERGGWYFFCVWKRGSVILFRDHFPICWPIPEINDGRSLSLNIFICPRIQARGLDSSYNKCNIMEVYEWRFMSQWEYFNNAVFFSIMIVLSCVSSPRHKQWLQRMHNDGN